MMVLKVVTSSSASFFAVPTGGRFDGGQQFLLIETPTSASTFPILFGDLLRQLEDRFIQLAGVGVLGPEDGVVVGGGGGGVGEGVCAVVVLGASSSLEPPHKGTAVVGVGEGQRGDVGKGGGGGKVAQVAVAMDLQLEEVAQAGGGQGGEEVVAEVSFCLGS